MNRFTFSELEQFKIQVTLFICVKRAILEHRSILKVDWVKWRNTEKLQSILSWTDVEDVLLLERLKF